MHAILHIPSAPFANLFPVFLGLVGILTSSLSADVVRMSNGDRLSGEVIGMEGQKLALKTSYAGTLRISWSEVSGVSLDEDMRLMVDSEQVVHVREVSRKTGGQLELVTGTGELQIAEEDLKALNPSPDESTEGGRLSGRVNVSWKNESGNNDKKDLDADYTIRYEIGRHRLSSTGAIEYDDRSGSPTKRDWNIGGSYSYYFTDNIYGSYWYQAKQEKDAGLELRQITGPAVGYEFIDNSRTRLLGQLGGYYVNERYFNQTGGVFWGPGLKVEFERKMLNDQLTFYFNNYFLFNAEDPAKRLWQSWTGFRYPIAGGIVASFEYEIDYDSKPSYQSEKLDQTTRLKLGYEW